MDHWERLFRYLTLFLVLSALVALPLVGFVQAEDGWDATLPMFDVLPPPIAVPPDSGEPDPARADRAATYEEEVLELTNIERWNNGQLPPLKGDSMLNSSSGTHSTNMAIRDFFAHCDLDTLTLPWDRMTAAGYNWNSAAENIAAGYSTPSAVVAGWMSSSGHRANILSTSYREIGIGYYYPAGDTGNVREDANGDCVADGIGGPWYRYWTQNFGRRNTVYPVVIDREAYETDTVDVDLYLYGTGWATEMRIRNENGAFGTWQAFSADVAWQLSDGPGAKEVFMEIRNGGTVYGASDTIESTAAATDLIFEDGFESGGTSGWDGTVGGS